MLQSERPRDRRIARVCVRLGGPVVIVQKQLGDRSVDDAADCCAVPQPIEFEGKVFGFAPVGTPLSAWLRLHVVRLRKLVAYAGNATDAARAQGTRKRGLDGRD